MTDKSILTNLKRIVLCLLFFSATNAIAQNNAEIVYEDGTHYSPIQKINFKDSIGNGVGAFDAIANNPYSHINGRLYKKRQGADIFEILDSCTTIDFAPPTATIPKEDARGFSPAKYYKIIVHPVTTQSGTVKGVVYTIRLYDEYFEERGSKAQFQMLDNSGNIMKKIHVKTDVLQTVVTDDGRFLGFNFGGIINENGDKVHDDGLSVFDTKTGEKLLEMRASITQLISMPMGIVDLIMFSIQEGYEYTKIVINPALREYYSKTYRVEELGLTIEINKKGIVFQKNDEQWEDSYTKDFEVIKF
jgi:hypothetical protein